MTDDLRNAIIDELLTLDGSEPRQPGDFTSGEYAARAGVTSECARYRLEKLISAGVLTSHTSHDDSGRRIKVYRRVDKKCGS